MPDNNKKSDKMSEIDDHIQKRFDIRRRLGKGAYGIVWKAVDRKTKKIVAIKKIFDAFRNQVDSQRTFREIMFLQAFSGHPNIIKLYSIHRAANNRDIYLGFEYMETDLHNVIKRQNLLKDIHMRYIMYQLFKAMKYIHSGNVIHRDMKPSNILLNSACHCKIADFGLARSISLQQDAGGGGTDAGSDPRLTDYVATRWYRAPEILVANTRYTQGIDMWSLGCILGEMLSGRPVFPGSSTVNQVEKIMTALPNPTPEDINSVSAGYGSSLIRNAPTSPKKTLDELLKECPADAIDLVTKLLVFNPTKRLTAVQCLNHSYVEKFHVDANEPSLERDVVPPLNDDIQLSVDDYRNKLYELMADRAKSNHNITNKHLTPAANNSYSKVSKIGATFATSTHHQHSVEQKIQNEPKPVRIQYKNAMTVNRNHIKNCYVQKEKSYAAQPGESKLYQYGDSNEYKIADRIHSDSKILEKRHSSSSIQSHNGKIPVNRNGFYSGDCAGFYGHGITNHGSLGNINNNCDVKPLRRTTSNTSTKQTTRIKNGGMFSSSNYNHFNPYNQNLGIITASALMDLKNNIR